MRKKIRTTEPVSYWKSMVDVITTLLMVVLLLLMFFVLNFLINNKDENFPEDDYHGAYDYSNDHDYDEPTETPTPTQTPTPTPYDNDGGGGGGYGFDDPGIYEEWGEGEGHDRSAIYAILIDEETGQTIEIPGIMFELYNRSGVRQTLTTHYPVPITYTQFETTDGGWFFLPEKIVQGDYYFRQLVEVPGYDLSSDTAFEVDAYYEWNDPLIVRIPLGAAKNNIQVQINDYYSGMGMPHVVFDVVANGDVTTSDGTVRYHNGEVVDVIECDDTGYGLSQELYLGSFVLVPRNLPYGYAAPELTTREVELRRRPAPGEYAPLLTLTSKLTTVTLKASDELYETQLIPNVEYRLTCDDNPDENRTFVTDGYGNLEITGLSKNATYRLVEANLPDSYVSNTDEYTFVVDALGLINGHDEYSIETTYRMIRVEINTVDRVFRSPLAGYNIELLDPDGNIVTTWISDGSSYEISGIEPGIYTLKIEDTNSETVIEVKDIKEVQKHSTSVMTKKGYIAIAGIGTIIIMILLVAIGIIVPRIKEKNKSKKLSEKKQGDK